jgi:N-acylneuraminate cytidylyltransferase/CMP-N,N'-diacetyllegionaminic acid synthase
MAGQGLLIIVAARGGSKGLPRKNTRRLRDLPLLGWTAEAVRRAELNGAVCLLSTDDSEIAEIGREVGLEAPFRRPAELATDTATAQAVALHALDWLAQERGVRATAVMWLQPTSPFRGPACLREAVSLMERERCAGVLGVKAVHRTLATLFHAGPDMSLTPVDPAAEAVSRRQDARTLYTPNGALYLVSAATLRKDVTFFPPSCRGIEMDAVASLDIDSAEDWEIAQAISAAGLTWRDRRAGGLTS